MPPFHRRAMIILALAAIIALMYGVYQCATTPLLQVNTD